MYVNSTYCFSDI